MSSSPPESKHKWRWWHPVLLLAILIAIVAVEQYWLERQIPASAKIENRVQGQSSQQGSGEANQPSQEQNNSQGQQIQPTENIKWVWVTMMVLLAAFILVAGHGITGYWFGALIDAQNKMSLSRFQMILWTILIMSAYLTAVLINIQLGSSKEATDIALDPSLWALMGISTASLVGSPLLKSKKKAEPSATLSPPLDTEEERTLKLLKDQGVDEVVIEGQIVSNLSPDKASWGDLFKGEDVSTAGHLDLAKVQMFYFTVITLIAYGVVLGATFDKVSRPITDFPELSAGILTLLGISHAGYLTSKAVGSSPPR